LAVYRIELVASRADYEQMLADPAAAGLRDAIELGASATGFELHLAWPEHRRLNLVVEGDADPDELGELIADQLAGSWEPHWTRVEAAERPPADLRAGEQVAWVLQMALDPDPPVCDYCGWVVPPHRPGCELEQRDDGREIRAASDPQEGGPGGRLVESAGDSERVEAVSGHREHAKV
jgi:hypothetical protein